MARREQIRWLRWSDVDWETEVLALAEEDDAAKTDAARRKLPIVPPLMALLRRAYLQAGRPDGKHLVFEPRNSLNTTGLINPQGLIGRVNRRWEAAGLQHLTLHQARHCGSTWLGAAGVSPKIHSYFVGHKTTTPFDGGAALTQNVYTHVLWEDVVEAGARFATHLAASQRRGISGAGNL
jgi:integrase